MALPGDTAARHHPGIHSQWPFVLPARWARSVFFCRGGRAGGRCRQRGAIAYGGGAIENFDTLASSGTSSTLPTGWYFTTGNNLTSYAADDGSLNTAGSVF